MWRFLQLLGICALIISGEGSPKRFHGIPHKFPIQPRNVGDRIPGSVVPSHYKIDLTVTADDLTNAVFTGAVEIVLATSAELTSFPIHAKNIMVLTLDLKDIDGKAVNTTHSELDTSNDFLTITGAAPIPKGAYILTITYNGTLSETDMDGFYKSTYKDVTGNTKMLATTQFEEMGARRAFPCFDEPALKAHFDVSITYPDGYNALHNTLPTADPLPAGTGLKKVIFNQTPLMSTYLIAFIVSEFNCVPGDSTFDVPTEMCARIGTEATMQTALETAPQSLTAMGEYTSFEYKNMEVGKLSQAAIPDFSAGAMENWGMVTYREADILWDEAESSNSYKQGVVSVITHELSHQWFGDYVTLDWWSDIFLNEGFATYFEYHATDLFQANWDMTKQFVIDQLQPVLLTDSSGSTYPLSFETNDPDVISSRFDDISYNKGGSILRMVHHLIGLENFKAGLYDYLGKERVATVHNLWTSFQSYADDLPEPQKLPATVENVLYSWTFNAGYPLLTVTLAADGKSVSINQKRFLLTDKADTTKWFVPITYTTSNSTDFTKTATQAWLTPAGALTIPLDDAEWILLNNQQTGYYRVDYDQKILDKLSAVLLANVDTIDEISRAQLVDDQLNLARGNRKDYGDVLGFLEFLKNDTSYYSWSSAFSGLSYLLKRTGDSAVQKAIKNYILQQSAKLVASVPLATPKPTDQIYTLKQVLAQTWACNSGDSACVKAATQLFVDYTKNDTNKVNPNLRGVAYCNGLRNSGNASADFDFLWDKYLTSDLATEKVTILRALGCSKDDTVRLNYLAKALTSDVRLQDYSYVFSSVYSNNPDGVDVIIEFVKQNYTNVVAHFGGQYQLLSLIANAADRITTQKQIDHLNEFVNMEGLDVAIKTAATEAVVRATTNLDVIKSLETSLKAHFKLTPSSASMTTVNLALILAVYLLFNFY